MGPMCRTAGEHGSMGRTGVHTAYTAQTCSDGGQRTSDLTLKERGFHCARCGLTSDRNARQNMVAV
jgi:transposase